MKHPIQTALHSSHTDSRTGSSSHLLKNALNQSQLSSHSAESIEPSHRKLILTLEGKIIREYPVENHSLSIGRRHGNDIQINDLTLSGRHALISSIPDYVFIEDLGSTNGTLVNGSHIKKVSLNHGDIIQIGNHQLTYLSENDVPYDPTMFIKAEHDETQFINTDNVDTQKIVKGLSLGGLKSMSKNREQSVPVVELRKTYSTIGFRGKRMALITRGTRGYSITAITGTHSRRASDIPMLNGQHLNDTKNLLHPGDIISIAGFDMQFYFLD